MRICELFLIITRRIAEGHGRQKFDNSIIRDKKENPYEDKNSKKRELKVWWYERNIVFLLRNLRNAICVISLTSCMTDSLKNPFLIYGYEDPEHFCDRAEETADKQSDGYIVYNRFLGMWLKYTMSI